MLTPPTPLLTEVSGHWRCFAGFRYCCGSGCFSRGSVGSDLRRTALPADWSESGYISYSPRDWYNHFVILSKLQDSMRGKKYYLTVLVCRFPASILKTHHLLGRGFSTERGYWLSHTSATGDSAAAGFILLPLKKRWPLAAILSHPYRADNFVTAWSCRPCPVFDYSYIIPLWRFQPQR